MMGWRPLLIRRVPGCLLLLLLCLLLRMWLLLWVHLLMDVSLTRSILRGNKISCKLLPLLAWYHIGRGRKSKHAVERSRQFQLGSLADEHSAAFCAHAVVLIEAGKSAISNTLICKKCL